MDLTSITELKEVSLITEVNELLQHGWKILAINFRQDDGNYINVDNYILFKC